MGDSLKYLGILLLVLSILLGSIPIISTTKSLSNDTVETTWRIYNVQQMPTLHEPITIIGDENFTSENGVIGGSGTKEDPYIISGWEIHVSDERPGIYIYNTTKYFIIKNCIVVGTRQGSGAGSYGIYLKRVRNGIITDVTVYSYPTLYYLSTGILLSSSENIIVNNTNIYYNFDALIIDNSNNIRVINNDIHHQYEGGILLYSGENIIIHNNTILYNGWRSIHVMASNNSISYNLIIQYYEDIPYPSFGILVEGENNTITYNNIFHELVGIELYSGSNIIMHNNISECKYGISITYTGLNIIAQNNIVNNVDYGIYVKGENNYIYSNNFISNGIQAYVEEGINYWDMGYPIGGNYWSDYNGYDQYRGPYQNISGSDGIGDTPYIINENNTDHYPLIYPLKSGNITLIFRVHGLQKGVKWGVTLHMPNGSRIIKETTDRFLIFILSRGYYSYYIHVPEGYYTQNPYGEFYLYSDKIIDVWFRRVDIEIYSEYGNIFYNNMNLTNRFYVKILNINRYEVDNVTGYIDEYSNTINFSYNKDLDMWFSVCNPGILPPGKHVLFVRVYSHNRIAIEDEYLFNVLQVPGLILKLSSENAEVEGKGYKIETSTEFKYEHKGLWDNSYSWSISLTVSWRPFNKRIDAAYIGGEWELGAVEFDAEVDLYSNGNVSISGTLKHVFKGKISSVDVDISLYASASGELYVNWSSLSVELSKISINLGIEAQASVIVPTPWSISIPEIGNFGLTVMFSPGISASLEIDLKPTNNTSEYLFGILPLKIDSVSGSIVGSVIISGQLGGKLGSNSVKLGAYIGVAGILGAGVFPQSLNDIMKSGAIVGEIDAFGIAYLGIYTIFERIQLVGPGIIYSWGNITNNELDELNNIISDQLDNIADLLDWVNGSWSGYVIQYSRIGGDYIAHYYNDSLYIYYTFVRPDGTSWIKGYKLYEFNRSMTNAPIPNTDALSILSPYIFELPNGSLAMLYAMVSRGNYSLDNLTILLQLSIFNDRRNMWCKPINITNSGVVLSYTSDGKNIYIIWSNSFNYTDTRLLVFNNDGVLMRGIYIPNMYSIIDAYNDTILIRMLNNSIVEIHNSEIKILNNISSAGFMKDGILYLLYTNKTMEILYPNHEKFSINLPQQIIDVKPYVINDTIYIIAVNLERILIYRYNKYNAMLTMVKDYEVSNLTQIRVVLGNKFLYLLPLITHNITLQNSSILLYIYKPPETGYITINTTLSKYYVKTGEALSLKIHNSPPNTTYNIFLDGELIGTITTNGLGEAITNLTVPLVPGGRHTISVLDINNTYYGSSWFEVIPNVKTDKNETYTPGEIILTGTGFASNQLINIYIDDNHLTTVKTNESGAFTAKLNIPLLPSGSHTIKILDYNTYTLLYSMNITTFSILEMVHENTETEINMLQNITNHIIGLINTTQYIRLGIETIILKLDKYNITLDLIKGKIEEIIIDLDQVNHSIDDISKILGEIIGIVDNISNNTGYIKTMIGYINMSIKDMNASLIGLITTKYNQTYALITTGIGIILTRIDDLRDIGVSLSDRLTLIIKNIDELRDMIDENDRDILNLLANNTGLLLDILNSTAFIEYSFGMISVKLDDLNASIMGLITLNNKKYALLNTRLGTILADVKRLSDIRDLLISKLNDILSKIDRVGIRIDEKYKGVSRKINENTDKIIEEEKDIKGAISSILFAIYTLLAAIITGVFILYVRIDRLKRF